MELLDVFVIYNLDDHKYTNWLAIPFLNLVGGLEHEFYFSIYWE